MQAKYQADHAVFFPSAASLEWFTRKHRRALVEAGALYVIAGRLYIHTEAFNGVVAAVGIEQARSAA